MHTMGGGTGASDKSPCWGFPTRVSFTAIELGPGIVVLAARCAASPVDLRLYTECVFSGLYEGPASPTGLQALYLDHRRGPPAG